MKKEAAAWAVGTATAEEIDRLNIRKAGALAMLRAIQALPMKPQFVIIDAFRIPGLDIPSKSIIKADLKVKSVAAASVIAKVERDLHLQELDRRYPGYGFAEHKGYGTKKHQAALDLLGPCAEHRMSYAPVKARANRDNKKDPEVVTSGS